MPQICGVVRRADSGAFGTSDAESAIAISVLSEQNVDSKFYVPANAAAHNHRIELLLASHRPVSSETTAEARRGQARTPASPLSQGRRRKYAGGGRHRLVLSRDLLDAGDQF